MEVIEIAVFVILMLVIVSGAITWLSNSKVKSHELEKGKVKQA